MPPIKKIGYYYPVSAEIAAGPQLRINAEGIMTIENQFKVGEIIDANKESPWPGRDRVCAYPAGTRFYHKDSDTVVTRAKNGFFFTDQSSCTGTYVVVSIPEAPKPEPVPDPIGEIAKKLWEQRNASLDEVGMSSVISEGFPSDKHEKIYRDLAELAVTGDWDELFPSAITDNDDDEWVYCGQGEYSMVMYPSDRLSLSEVNNIYGIKSVEK